MSAEPSLAPAGSSTYSSNTLHVGDGTWDATSDTFLLPNIQGLNFATMQFNGMGNRFRDLKGYYQLTVAHGTLAAITFLFIVPTAILVPTFYHRNPRFALRVHIGLQVLTVLLTTVIFVLGYFAVGPERSLTNPHHGIGLAIYLLVLVQAMGGWIIKKIEKGKVRYYRPVKLMLHQWLGRGIALLAFAQIPIGLTLYGSPASLFVLYTLWMTFLLILLFVLVHRNHKRIALAYQSAGGGGSWVSGSRTEMSYDRYTEKPGGRHLTRAAEAVGLGAALGALRRRTSGRQAHVADTSDMASTLPPSQAPTGSHLTGDRFTESNLSDRTRQHTWRNRLLGAGAGVGGAMAARRFFGRNREREDTDFAPGTYQRPPLGGPVPAGGMPPVDAEGGRPYETQDNWQRIEQAEAAQQAAMTGGMRPGVPPTGYGPRAAEDYAEMTPEKPARFNRWGLPALGAAGGLGALGGYFKRRRDRREEERIEAETMNDQENERLFTSPGGRPRYTGDGTPRRGNMTMGATGPATPGGPVNDGTGSPTRTRARPQSALFTGRGTMEEAYADGTMAAPHPPPTNIPPPPRSSRMPPPPPLHSSPMSTARGSPSDIHRQRHEGPEYGGQSSLADPQSMIGARHGAVGAASSVLSPPQPPYARSHSAGARTHSNSPHAQGVDSPPVSVKVKMSNNGRHVTLRRLNEDEAARERQSRRGRDDVAADDSDMADEAGYSRRFRRDQTPTARPPTSAGQQTSELHLPTHEQMGSGSAIGGPATTGSPYETGTDVTDFDSNRRRRRAERARAEQARQQRKGGGTGHVEFT